MPIQAPAPKQRFGIREPSQVRSDTHRAWVRKQPCILRGKAGHLCQGPVQAAHFRMGNGGGQGLKPCDRFVFSCCWAGHDLQHCIGEPEFQRRFGLNLGAICADLAKRSPCPKVRERVAGR